MPIKHLEQYLMHKGIRQIFHFLLATPSSHVTILSTSLYCLFQYWFEIENAALLHVLLTYHLQRQCSRVDKTIVSVTKLPGLSMTSFVTLGLT